MNDELIDQLEDDASAGPRVNDDALRGITEACTLRIKLAAEVEEHEKQIEDLNKRLFRLDSETIPALMRAADMKSFQLTDGSSVEVKRAYDAYVKIDDVAAAHRWLEENGHGALIKREFKAAFGRGEEEAAKAMQVWLTAAGRDYEMKEGVNAQTLKAFVKEQIENGRPLSELLGARVFDVARIQKSKEERAAEKAKKKEKR